MESESTLQRALHSVQCIPNANDMHGDIRKGVIETGLRDIFGTELSTIRRISRLSSKCTVKEDNWANFSTSMPSPAC